MTVKELKSELDNYPDDMDVFIDERKTDFKYGLVNGVRQLEITMGEDEDEIDYEDEDKPYAKIPAIILTED